MDDAVFSVDLVGGFGDDFAWWLLTHDILLGGWFGGYEVRWVGLAEAELLQLQRCLDFWDILVDPPLERLEVDGLPHFAASQSVLAGSTVGCIS